MFGSRIGRWGTVLGGIVLAVATCSKSQAAPLVAVPFDSSYTISNLGSIIDVPVNYGGLTLFAGSSNTLLIGGSANNANGQLYQVTVTRDSNGHINGFAGPATVFGPAPYNDGGVVYGPGGVLFAAQWPVNTLSQYLPGSTSPDKQTPLGAFGVTSLSALNFVPAGFGGAGQMKLVAYSGGEFYTAEIALDTTGPDAGTYDIVSVTQVTTLPGGPEGFIYVPTGSPEFSNPSMLVSEYLGGNIAAYDVDANGNPILSSRRDFITGLTGAEGAFIDPLTGDFLFSTFGSGNEVFVVQGFRAPTPGGPIVPEPTSLALAGFAGLGLVARAWRRRRAIAAE